MLVIIASSLMFTELKETAFQMFTMKMKGFWNKWEPRGMVLLSLTLQIVLFGFGNHRKSVTSYWRVMLVWLAYLSADWVATIALGTLMKSQGEIRTALVAFWVPFLLLHLGGSDTITAYSLEDSGLWLRHLLRLCVQVVLAFYVYWKYQTNSVITILAIPIFVAGIIKYGERIWILRYASSKKFKNTVFAAPAPKLEEVEEMNRSEERMDLDTYLSRKGIISEARYLHKAYLLFKVFKPLLLDLNLRLYRELHDILTIKSSSAAEAFKLVEGQLGFLYDLLYTKRTLLIRPVGVILRFICLLSCCSALVAFSLIIGFGEKRHSKVDIGISYLLLVGAVALEICSVVLHGLSDWAMLWATRNKNWLATFVYWATSSRLVSGNDKEELQLQFMSQCNLISFCLKSKTSKIAAIERFLNIDLRKYWYRTWEHVNYDLKEMIYSHLLKKCKQYEESDFEYGFLSNLLAKYGNGVLEEKGILNEFSWSITELEFDYSLLLWHIATHLCYYADSNKYATNTPGSHCKMSKSLSDYMLYLLVMHPSMLPQGINEVRFRDTCEQIMRFLSSTEAFDSIKASEALFFDSDDRPNIEIPGKSKSALNKGVVLANRLQSLVTTDHWDHEEKWEIISHVWVEMLTYVASNCGWKEHAQQLKRGRELLTHVSLLMAHLGLTTKIHIVPLPIELQYLDYKPPWNWDSLYHLAYYLA